MRHGGFWFVAAVGVGGLQAWDAGAWSVGATVAGLAAAGILLPAATLPARVNQTGRIGALVAGAGLLLVARVLSPIPLNTLHLSLFPSAIAILFVAGRTPGTLGTDTPTP